MPDGRDAIAIKVVDTVGAVPAADWDACAGAGNPFLGHGFLAALEESGSAAPETGWVPRHLVVEGEDGRVLACAPLYLKDHSYGEYVFDWGWADAFQRAGGRYYPKLQSAVPFTPVTGRRLLVRPGAPAELADALIAGMVTFAERLGVSSLHVTFLTEAEWTRAGELGLLQRTGQQFHWRNEGYASFDEFLARLSSRKRKAIRRERDEVARSGVTIRTLVGADIAERHWDAFFRFYRNTSDRKWGDAYLNRAFFSLLHRALGDRVVLVMAEDGGRPVGGALNLLGGDTLYGRYWGAVERFNFLHFEACYYRAIDFAIAHGLAWVEAGAQGPHKVQRGYLPRRTHSAHWIADPAFREAVARFLAAERQETEEQMALWREQSPFRNEGAA